MHPELCSGALAGPDTLRIQGSNTLGAALLPALVRGLLEARGLQDIQTFTPAPGEQLITAHEPNGSPLRFAIAAHGSSTGFDGLLSGQADLAASSRPISDPERVRLAPLGDLTSFAAEHVIAIDGVAVIVHPDNPLRQLTTQQLAQVFSGEIDDWRVLGGRGPIHVLARDDRSGTWETFPRPGVEPLWQPTEQPCAEAGIQRAIVGSGQCRSPSHRFHRPGLGAHGPSPGDRRWCQPAHGAYGQLIATQDYPLSRRLYLYSAPTRPSPGPTR